MKIERLSENQIRCTLDKTDLAEKELLLTELAYGTDKAKELFRELMQQASNELGFEADNVPLMIEAIPVSPECLVLVITKVEDPEELDTRFSRFTNNLSGINTDRDDDEDDDDFDDIEIDDDSDNDSDESNIQEKASRYADGILSALGGIAEGLTNALSNNGIQPKPTAKPSESNKSDMPVSREAFRIYAFKNLDNVILSAKLVKGMYDSENTLYKNPKDSIFYLYLTKDKNTDGEFIKTCNILGEYGSKIKATYATPLHMEEHFKLIIDANALQTLSDI